MSSFYLNSFMAICFVAGKSGGHLLPCLTQATQIKQENPQTTLYVFTCGSPLDYKITQNYPDITHLAPTPLDNPPYGQPWMLPWFAVKTAWYFLKSFYLLWQIKPAKVISMGGFVAIPTCLAAKILGIDIQLYELNVEPGKATVFLSKFTDTIYTCFAATQQYFPKHRCQHFDYPVRFSNQDLVFDKQALLQKYGLTSHRKTVLILGGSQGSVLLNQTMKELIETNLQAKNGLQFIHQTGASDDFDYAQFYQEHHVPAHVFSYSQHLQDFYNIADIIVCRAGAGTLFEIKFFNKKCITIPHQTANTNHQIKNVLELQQQYPEQFIIIPQSDFSVATMWPYLL